jgi:hypothetical protein
MKFTQPRCGETIMSSSNERVNVVVAGLLSAGAFSMLAACGGISAATKERLAQTQTSVQQAQSTLGTSESGAVELQRAREHLEAAQRAADKGSEGEALRHATEAQLQAELAVAKSQSATARKAAADTLASIEALRKESVREPVRR